MNRETTFTSYAFISYPKEAEIAMIHVNVLATLLDNNYSEPEDYCRYVLSTINSPRQKYVTRNMLCDYLLSHGLNYIVTRISRNPEHKLKRT